MPKEETKKLRPNWKKRSFIVGALILLVWFFTLWSFLWGPDWINVGNRGTFGDMFGGLTSLFSGFAFAGIVISIFMQREELELTRETLEDQRQELELTRTTLEAQKAEMVQQNQTLGRQQFENTFYQLLAYFNTYIGEIKVGRHEGRINFTIWMNDIVQKWRQIRQNAGDQLSRESKAILETKLTELEIAKQFSDWFYEGSPSFHPNGSLFSKAPDGIHTYFRMLFNIFIYVSESDLTDGQKQFYIGIVRAQISDSELFMIFYYCLKPEGEQYRQFAEEFRFFKNLNVDNLLPCSGIREKEVNHFTFVDAAAFG
ncbi:MAG: putative phage abortive infection protein [Alphaproteobacteria bacterium]|nr:putative phage abortive infection protein [Alphaproteobacteria bacterium]